MSIDRGGEARLGTNVVSSATSIALTNKDNFTRPSTSGSVSPVAYGKPGAVVRDESFLRIPPFPGSSLTHFVVSTGKKVDVPELASELRNLRVGGAYWAAQPELPGNYVLVRDPAYTVKAADWFPGMPIVLWSDDPLKDEERACACVVIGPCDPWHMLADAAAVVADAAEDVSIVAAVLGVPWYKLDASGAPALDEAPMRCLETLASSSFQNPFFGYGMNAIEAAELCGYWRRLIDNNRNLAGGLGFAFWKQEHVGTLLWGGSEPFKFLRAADISRRPGPIAIWRSKVAPAILAELEQSHRPVVEVEDGFLRSRGLGADFIPPLSITVDRLAPHFDPSQFSELELLLEQGEFDGATLERARLLRSVLVERGIGKYDRGTTRIERPAGEQRHVLVPGQVEDDRAVKLGGCGLTSNLELLKRVREQEPDAYILYKPHPDVVAG